MRGNDVRYGSILLQNTLVILLNDDSVALMRFAFRRNSLLSLTNAEVLAERKHSSAYSRYCFADMTLPRLAHPSA
jgi:hypothetical protein